MGLALFVAEYNWLQCGALEMISCGKVAYRSLQDESSRRCRFHPFLPVFVFLALAFPPGGDCAEPAGPPRHPTSTGSVPTEIRLESSTWWPTTGYTNREEYVGSKACVMCHAQKVASQTATSMARASTRAADSDQLKAHPNLSLQLGSYSYKLLSGNGSAVLSVSAGEEGTSKNLEWAIGDGRFGQTFIYREQSRYYESQLSYYSRLNGLGTTTGHMEPKTLETAAGGLTTPIMIHQCFGCHSTASTTKSRFDPDGATMGITCEACHGPGASHVLLESQTGETGGSSGSIMNPANLGPWDSVDFCGACHRTAADAVISGLSKMGAGSVRMQPYRLQKSKCWGSGDARITCTSCHDPHVQVVSDPAVYDSKCFGCHLQKTIGKAGAVHRAPACKVGKKDCVTCHMPKVEVPGTYTTFTDHWIRIARKGAPFPD